MSAPAWKSPAEAADEAFDLNPGGQVPPEIAARIRRRLPPPPPAAEQAA